MSALPAPAPIPRVGPLAACAFSGVPDGGAMPAVRRWIEADRDEALGAFGILDTPPEAEFDDIARMAADACGTEFAIVNFVDARRQFFKAEVGIGSRSAPMEVSFCKHAVLRDDVMVVPDATLDPLFRDNAVVTGEPHVRFYAGAVIRTRDGVPVGTVCVLGKRPQVLAEQQVRMLRHLARQAMTQLELRLALAERDRALADARAAERGFREMTDGAPAILLVRDAAGRCTYLNRAWHEFTGQARDEAVGDGWLGALHPDDAAGAARAFLEANARHAPFSIEYRLRTRDGGYRWAVDSGSPRFDAAGAFVGYVGTVIDIDGLRRSEERKQVALGELSHRMKNHLAMVKAIVTQSLRHAGTTEEAERSVEGRISALADAQDLLVRPEGAPSTVSEVVAKALRPHVGEGTRVSYDGPATVLTPDRAVGLALALHELATNSAKYGALSSEGGRVSVTWDATGGAFRFEWAEAGGPPVATPISAGFGTKLLARVVPGYFGGRAVREFDPSGLRYVLEGTLADG